MSTPPLFLVIALAASPLAAGDLYTNPVGETPIHMGDPFVIQHDDKYYLFGTNASNEGFKCWESTDLVHWSEKGWAYRETDDTWAKTHYWAPEVKFYRGKFYMTYSAMNKASDPPRLLIALAVSDKPEGPYRDLHAPWFDFGYSAIDGHIFVDDDGKPYLYFSRNGFQDGYSFGIMYGVALADNLSRSIGEPMKLMEADQPWEKVRYAENRCNEGAFVLKQDGRYYMTYSANHTGFPHYGIGYATADKPLGPWVKAEENPIAATNADIGVSGPGHSCITTSPDGTEMFIVYHTHADAENPSGDRVVNIDRIGFDESGKLKITGPTRSPQPMPSGTATFAEGPVAYDPFAQDPIPKNLFKEEPTTAGGYYNRGGLWYGIGEYDKAIADLTESIKLNPNDDSAYLNRGNAWMQKGDLNKAIADYSQAICLAPGLPSSYSNRGMARRKQCNYDKAVADFSKAIRLGGKKNNFVRHDYLLRGLTWRDKGDYPKAVADYAEAMPIPSAFNELAWVLATSPLERFRDGKKAVEHATKACELTGWSKASHIDTLAAAYAEADDFQNAMKWQQKAIQTADEQHRKDYEARLNLYKAGKPYREEPKGD